MHEKIAQLILNNQFRMDPSANLNEDVVGIGHSDNIRNLTGKVKVDKNTDEKEEPKIIVKQVNRSKFLPRETPEPHILLNKIPDCNRKMHISTDQDPIQPKVSKKSLRQSKAVKIKDSKNSKESTPPPRKSDED